MVKQLRAKRDITPVIMQQSSRRLVVSGSPVTGRILQAQVQIDAGKIAVERAQKMLNAEAGSVRGVDEAKATQITVKLRPENAALHGLTAGQVRQAVTTIISGRKVGEVYQEQRVHDVTVWSVPACGRTTPRCGSF